MMKKSVMWLCLVIAVGARAEERIVRGSVTYLAGGTVYTSLGRNAGVEDSTLLFIVTNKDTTVLLKIFAVSSKSSACRVLKALRPITIGDEVTARIEVAPVRQADSSAARQTPSPTQQSFKRTSSLTAPDQGFINLQGRISAQYFTSRYDNSAFNIAQPGVVLNMRGTMRDAPMKFDLYANLRTLSVGNRSPFAQGAINQSRIYGLSLSFDDGENVVSLGRIIPIFAPSIGYIDGALLSRKLGDFTIGATLGLQPDFSLRSVSSDFKKIALFAQYSSPDRLTLSVSAAYARTYHHSALDREAASVLLNAALAENLFLYANTEMDLRKKSGAEFILSPRLTSAYVNFNYRVARSFSAGVGVDASRAYYSFQSVRSVPDSLLMDDLRSGLSLNFGWSLPGGIMLYDTYTPRNATNGAFGSEYSNYSSLSFNDVFSTGINIRSNMNLNANQYTSGTGYGISLQRSFAQFVDINLRYQRNGYTVKQTDHRDKSTTIGADLMVFLSRALTFTATYDRLDGYGTKSNSLFAEFGVRF
jgi:hypothetical protein